MIYKETLFHVSLLIAINLYLSNSLSLSEWKLFKVNLTPTCFYSVWEKHIWKSIVIAKNKYVPYNTKASLWIWNMMFCQSRGCRGLCFSTVVFSDPPPSQAEMITGAIDWQVLSERRLCTLMNRSGMQQWRKIIYSHQKSYYEIKGDKPI